MNQKEAIQKAIDKIKAKGVGEIISLANKEFIDGFECVVFYDAHNDSYSCVNLDQNFLIDNEFELIPVHVREEKYVHVDQRTILQALEIRLRAAL